MFNFGSGEDLVEGGKEAGKKASEDYEEHRYHAPGDEYDAIANWDGMLADLQLYYAAGRMLEMTDAWPNWVEGDEFRAARDKSRAAASKHELPPLSGIARDEATCLFRVSVTALGCFALRVMRGFGHRK